MKLKYAAALFAGLALATHAHAANVSLTITGIEARGGQLMVGLQTENQFLQAAGIAGEIFNNPGAGSKTVTLDVPVGRYSVSVLHDEDGDGDMAIANKGMPMEGWTMPNAEALRGAPTFDVVGFDVPEVGTSLTLQMIYPEAK